MGSTRRSFVKQSAEAVALLAVAPLGCSRVGPLKAPMGEEAMAWEPGYLALARSGELAARAEQLWEVLASCRLCPRRCGANRLEGEVGVCSSTARLKVHSAGPHFGEEPPLVGRWGSGTIFFSNCNLLCCFCQNWEINHRGDGAFLGIDALADMMLALQERGCHNINLVTPTHVVPHIVRAVIHAIPRGLRLPLVYNTGGYDNPEIVALLDGIVDIYLPDFKYQDGEVAAKFSAGARDYPEVAAEVIREMHRQVGVLAVDERGIARRGLIIRHLVLPNNLAGTDRFVRWVAAELGPGTAVNIMSQYRPEHRAPGMAELARRLTPEEWRQALAWAREAGLTNLVS